LEFLVISYSCLAFILFVLILAPYGKREDEKQNRIDKITDAAEKRRYEELNISFFDRTLGKAIKKLSAKMSELAPKQRSDTKSKKLEIIQRQLRYAGIFMDAENFNFIKTVVLVVAIVITLIAVMVVKAEPLIKLLILAVGSIVGIMGPTYYLNMTAKNHQLAIRNQLPDAMDMLCVCIEAGLSFDASLIKVSEKLHGPFIDELLIVYREISMGVTRREALQHMCDSTTLDELKTFASALIQAEQLGIPVNNVMRAQADQLRIQRSQLAKEKGNKASIKMLIPMLLFIFPVIFIILMGPAAMNIIEMFKNQ